MERNGLRFFQPLRIPEERQAKPVRDHHGRHIRRRAGRVGGRMCEVLAPTGRDDALIESAAEFIRRLANRRGVSMKRLL